MMPEGRLLDGMTHVLIKYAEVKSCGSTVVLGIYVHLLLMIYISNVLHYVLAHQKESRVTNQLSRYAKA